MKDNSLSSYRGNKFIEQRINDLGDCLKNRSRQEFRITRKCSNFIERVDTVFNALPTIEDYYIRRYIALSLKKQFEHELYNDLKFNTGAEKEEKALKDELYGYLKFKMNFYSKKTL